MSLDTGPGGAGKTRLAGRTATTRYQSRWAVAQAVQKGPRSRPGIDREPPAGDQPLLVVADYAERWALGVLVELVENLPLVYPSRRVRVLLLARPSPGLWDTIAAQLDRGGVHLAEPISLGEFTTDRAGAFTAAATAFIDHIAPGRPPPDPRNDLNDPGYGSVLDLHMAALAAVCAADTGDRAPTHEDLSEYLLSHERRGWTDTTGRDPHREHAMETMAWLATLFGPTTGHTAALALLRHAGMADGQADAARLLTDYERLYPPVRSEVHGLSPTAVVEVATLQPIRPDRFGEDLIAAVLRKQPHALELLTHLTTNTNADSLNRAALRRCLIVLAATATRHPTAADGLRTLIRARPELAVIGGATVLNTVVTLAPHDVADTTDQVLPRYDTELLQPACDLAQRLTDTLTPDTTPAARAHRLTILSVRLSNLGRHEQALAATEQAVEIRRRLAATNPTAFEPDLATSLTNLGNRLSNLGRHEQALAATEQAVQIYRRLAATNPTAFEPDLAQGLWSFASVRAAHAAELEAALPAANESVALYERLHEQHPQAFLNDLRGTLSTLADVLAGLARVDESEQIRRRIEQIDAPAS